MVLFAFFAAMAETERENIRDATLEGLTAAAPQGKPRAAAPRRSSPPTCCTPFSGAARTASQSNRSDRT